MGLPPGNLCLHCGVTDRRSMLMFIVHRIIPQSQGYSNKSLGLCGMGGPARVIAGASLCERLWRQ